MADWSGLSVATAYASLLSQIQGLAEDAAKMAESPTSPPTGYIRWNTSLNKFQRWSGAAWVDIVLAAAGGGTGGTTALGTMAYQSASAVAITGGTIQGVTTFQMAGDITFDGDGTRSIGAYTARANKVYIKNALVVPVGTDMYATS
jgi:hypothetical protein